MSTSFTVLNGVIKGGILSPVLFNFYLEYLSKSVSSVGVDCELYDNCNHLCYAVRDDCVLLAPSSVALQILLGCC